MEGKEENKLTTLGKNHEEKELNKNKQDRKKNTKREIGGNAESRSYWQG